MSQSEPEERPAPDSWDGARWWFIAALAYAAGCGWLALRSAFGAEYVVQDDARQHVTWLLRFTDPGLFPGDLLADYFRTLTPAGFSALYRGLAALGMDALLAGKLLPPALGVVSAAYCFGACRRMARLPMAAFLSSVILMQSLWMNKDLASATPRAFLYPLFIAFIYYLAKRSRLGVCAAVALQGLFYPQILLISMGVMGLSLFRIEGRRIKFAAGAEELKTGVLAAAIAAVALGSYSYSSGLFGPLVSLATAQGMPEFHQGGRMPMFGGSAWFEWVKGTGGLHLPTRPYLLWLGILLPCFCARPGWFPGVNKLRPELHILSRIAWVSIGLFVAAHLLLFRLYLPSRYTQHTARIILSLCAGMALAIVLERVSAWSRKGEDRGAPARRWMGISASGAVCLGVAAYPVFLMSFPSPGYVVGESKALYRYLAQQPKETMVASLAEEANNLPTFARRSTLVAREFAMPLHTRFYALFEERVRDLVDAQYTSDPRVLSEFIAKYRVTHFLLDANAFDPAYLRKNRLARQFAGKLEGIEGKRAAGGRSIVGQAMREGVAFDGGRLVLIEARRLVQR